MRGCAPDCVGVHGGSRMSLAKPFLRSIGLCGLLAGAIFAFSGPAGAASPPVEPPRNDLKDGDTLSDLAKQPTAAKDKVPKPPRNEAESIAGAQMLQVEPLWLPVKQARPGVVRYMGVTVRLTPKAGLLTDACYKMPWVTEALILYFNRHQLDANPSEGDRALDKAILKTANSLSAKPLFEKAQLLPIDGTPRPISDADQMLSQVCS